ncbi:MAG: hypothetical protein FWG90_04895 [Oscillospiraceae bacterium]|nr:hypothetical protein [Oscillospiraceae bacterium]
MTRSPREYEGGVSPHFMKCEALDFSENKSKTGLFIYLKIAADFSN